VPFQNEAFLWSVDTIVDDRVTAYQKSHDRQGFVNIFFMEEIARHFASAVKFNRKRLGISQEAFAHKAGIHRTYASSIERGRVQVSIAIASQLAEALEIPLNKLFRDVERFANGELSEDSVGK